MQFELLDTRINKIPKFCKQSPRKVCDGGNIL